MSEPFQGGCACGAIRYECRAQPVASFNCHCRACQQFTGSAFISGMLMPGTAFALLSGEPTYYTSQSDQGESISRGFCATCGSPVVTRFERMPDMVAVPAASLDDPSRHRPEIDIFTSYAQPWDVMNPDLPKFPKGPEKK